ncbi:GDSL-type esterase/lipase family protein [Paenibacillus gansuensis]|uniref:GDSL-type esterase/lipase family protein n=1 Tax=Paenibacillus gansuensis TaxID=306542 RepID=A0ABW5PCS3_9BACL
MATKEQMHYTALGDSLTVGFGSSSGEGFVEKFRRRLEADTGAEIQSHNFGVNGATSLDIAKHVIENQQIQEMLKVSKWITITAGGNDLLRAAEPYFRDGTTDALKKAIHSYRLHLQQLLHFILDLKRGRESFDVFLLTIYNPIPYAEEARIWVRRFNRPLKYLQSPYITVVPVHEAFGLKEEIEGLLCEDYIHPNDSGYRLMEESLFQTYKQVTAKH